MTTPFEIFRTPITIYRQLEGFYDEGRWVQGSQASLSADTVTGNSIAITFNSVVLTPIPFTTSHAVTMGLVKSALEAQAGVLSVNLSGTNDRVITVTPEDGLELYFDSFSITGGASQPTVTLVDSPIAIATTASIQPLEGEEMEMMPEGRHELKGYKLYTSTRINTVTDVNPAQVEIFGDRYEITRVWPWQNNANFNIINHYKYLAVQWEPLGAE